VKKIPYLVVLGDKEVAEKTVAVRKYGSGEQGVLSQEDFIGNLLEQLKNKQ